jgi:hypothetical protein
MGKIRIRDENPCSYFRKLKKFRVKNTGMEKFVSGIRNWSRNLSTVGTGTGTERFRNTALQRRFQLSLPIKFGM